MRIRHIATSESRLAYLQILPEYNSLNCCQRGKSELILNIELFDERGEHWKKSALILLVLFGYSPLIYLMFTRTFNRYQCKAGALIAVRMNTRLHI